MRKIFFALILSSALFAGAMPGEAPAALVKQGICYNCPHAQQVYLVWGINHWKSPDPKLWPPGTFQKAGLLYSPMAAAHGTFTQQLALPKGTQLDYVFWITKGPRNIPCDVWDLNTEPQKDYHSLAMNDNTTLVNARVQVSGREQISVLHYARPWLAVSVMLALFFMLLKRNNFDALALKPDSYRVILATGFTLLLVLLFSRASAFGLGWDIYYKTAETLPRALWAGYYDYLYVLVLTIFFILAVFTTHRLPLVRRLLTGAYVAIAVLSAVASLLNIQVLEKLGKPFNLRWLYYADFLHSADAKAALTFNLAPDYLLNLSLVIIGAVIMGAVLLFGLELLINKFRFKRMLWGALVGINITYVAFAQSNIKEADYARLANPIVAFAESLEAGEGHPQLYTMPVPDSLNPDKKTRPRLALPVEAGKIKNVLMVVLESTPAEFVQPYDKKYRITPELSKQLGNAIVFNNVYAHAPATNKSMVSILASVYPWLSFNSITNEYPGVNLPTLSSELKRMGYRTAFFNSGDNRFQRTGEFLAHRGFDVVKDCRQLPCQQYFEEKSKSWGPLDGVNDECTARELRSWLQAQPGRNFFAMLWTYQTHYPYYTNTERRDIETYDSTLNRYLNAVAHSDRVLGQIIEGLKDDGLFESTLLVVVGDHGEAFGRHNQTTHASMIYEENVHIPCVFINPALPQQVNENIGGLVDLAPTLMSLLGYPGVPSWQGQNLFGQVSTRRTYFFCPWSDYLYGFREGDKKYIYNASSDHTEVYDLKKDPFEEHNLADQTDVVRCHEKLAAWVQHQDRFMKKVLH